MKRRGSFSGAETTGETVKDSPPFLSETSAAIPSGSPPGSRKNKNKSPVAVHPENERWIVIGLTLLGAILRWCNLGTNSLWLDEAATSFFSTPGVMKIWESIVTGEFNPPLFYVLEHFMIGMYGNTELVLRFLPAVFGVLAIPVFYLVGKEFKDKTTGTIMAILCTVSPFLIWYSQEARAYTLLLLLIAGATYYYFRALRTDGLWDWVLVAVFGAVAFWTHFYAAVIMFALYSFAIFAIGVERNKDEIIRKGKPVFISMCICILIVYPLLMQMGSLWAKRTASAPTYGIQGFKLINATFQQLSGFSDIALFLFFTLFCLGVIGVFFKNRGKGIFLIWVMIFTLVSSIFASGIIPMLPRYLIFLSVFFYLGIAASYLFIQEITGWSRKRILIVFFVTVVLVSAPFLAGYYSNPTKEDWRIVSKDLQQLTQPGDTVVTVPTYLDLPLGYYYSSFRDGTDMQGSITEAGLELARANANGTVWYVMTGDIMAADPTGSSFNWVRENTQIKKQYYGGIYITKGI